MWNKIKGTPYVAAGRDGKVQWIAGGYQNQLGLESQVVGAICTFYPPLCFSFIFIPCTCLLIADTPWLCRRSPCILHRRALCPRPCSDICGQAAYRGLPLARYAGCSVQLVDEVVQDEEWRIPLLFAFLT